MGWILLILQAAFIFCKVAQITAIATLTWFWVLTPLMAYGALIVIVVFTALVVAILESM